MIGQTLAHYRVSAAIGAGGMGEVYRATDTKLGRDVALKVLPAELAENPQRRERFQREAKALAALDHPGIVTVYSVEEADGVHFLTMQLVDGQPLSELIPAGGLEPERVREIGTALAQALAAAHEKGIVHRDLKPANVMLTRDARVKILDFGLAKITTPESSSDSSLATETPTSDGLTEEVITDLARIEALRVISRNSAMALKGTTRDTPSIARELNVTHVVSGSVRTAGDALRVTVELVDAARDAPIWSEKYSGTLADVFGIQEEIARKVVAALRVKLTPSEERQAAERPIENVVAYDAYLRARQEMYHWTPESSRRAHRLVDEALAIVGDVPLLLATKGQLHWNEVNTNLVPAAEALARAAALVARALAVDPDLPLAIYVRGLVAGSRGQLELALPDLHRAHALAPNDANMLAEAIRFSNVAGLRHHGAMVDRIVAIDPLTPITSLCVSSYHWVNGNWAETAAAGRRSIELAEEPSMLHVIAGWQIATAGLREEAATILRRAAQACADGPLGPWTLFLERALAGDAEAALGQATNLEGAVSNEFAARLVAEGYALLGRNDDALRWLRKAIRLGFVNHPSLTELAPFLAGLRDHPEFRDLMRPVKVRWQALVEWERQHRAAERGETR